MARALADELIYQGYTVSRASGFRPVSVQSAIRNSRVNKLLSAVVSSALIALYMFLYYESAAGQLRLRVSPVAVAIVVFAWSGFSVVMMLTMAIYSLQGTGYIRDFIYTLPFESWEVERVSIMSVFSIIDLQLYAMVALALLSLFIFRSALIFFSIVFGLETAILVFEALSRVMSRRRLDLKSAVRSRLVVSVIPLIYVLIFVLIQPFSQISPAGVAGELIPLLDFALTGSPVATASSLVWIIVTGYVAIRLFKSTALSFFTISHEALVVPVKERGWRITGPTFAMLQTDIRQVFRSNLAGMFLAPLLLAAIVLFQLHGVQAGELRFVAVAYGIELALLSALPAYSIYMAEMRGALAIRIMPLSRARLALPKIVIAILSYYIFEGALIVALLIRGAGILYILPLILGSLGPAASVLLVSIIFEKTIMSGGALSMPVSMLALLLELIVVALPFAFYFAALLLGLGAIYASLFELVISAMELALLYYIVSSYERG